MSEATATQMAAVTEPAKPLEMGEAVPSVTQQAPTTPAIPVPQLIQSMLRTGPNVSDLIISP